jgi:hypothetical protein
MQKEVILVMLYMNMLGKYVWWKIEIIELYLLVISNLIRAVYYLTITKEEHIGKKNNNQGGKVEIVYELNYGLLV